MTDRAYASNPIAYVLRRLNTASEISPEAEKALGRAIFIRPSVSDHVEVKVDTSAAFLLKGLACRMRLMADGRRQLTGFIIAGDLCGQSFLSGTRSITQVVTLAKSVVADVSMPLFTALCDEHPDILRALMRATATGNAVTEELIVSLGLRTAAERLGHLFCEMHQRLSSVGLVNEGSYAFQVTQAELGAQLGMSAVHVNRTLQRLRREKLISTEAGRINILNGVGLRRMASYDPAYLN